jgi:hypothetical protein
LAGLARDIGPFDFIIDDGSHVNSHQIESFRILWPFLKDGGTYIVEDVQTSYWPYFGGGPLTSSAYEESCMSFFKRLADSVNMAEFLMPLPGSLQLERSIGSIAFHHNLIVIKKDMSLRRSNLPIDEEGLRDMLMKPNGGAGA